MIPDKFKTTDNVPPSFYRAKLMKDLEIKGKFGYIVTNSNLMEGSIFEAKLPCSTQYKIRQLIKIDGFALYYFKISRCDRDIVEADKDTLKEGTIIKTIYTPVAKIRPGYDL